MKLAELMIAVEGLKNANAPHDIACMTRADADELFAEVLRTMKRKSRIGPIPECPLEGYVFAGSVEGVFIFVPA